jgi:CubicO group peptidase (beta-lactamase class C family)
VLTKADADAWLDGYMPYALRTADIPGAVVVVVKDGKVVTSRGFGYADVDKKLLVDPERSLFRIGSVSKLVTWMAVMQMVEQNKVDLDADINTYLDFKIPARNGTPITMRQVMTHTAGFEEAIKNLIFFDQSRLKSLGDTLKAWTPTRIFDAGTTPAYSNYATALAGYVVERVAGMPFDDYVEKNIFNPLGMKSASFRQPLPAALQPQMAVGYPKPGQPSPGFEIVGPAPAGSMSASGNDMARFMIANLQFGEIDGQRIMSAATAKTMLDSPLDKINPVSLISPLNRMELGFFETNINNREVVGHLGDTVAFHTSLHLFMKENVGFYLSVNSGGKAGASNTVRLNLFQDFADRYFPDAGARDGSVDAKDAAEHARMMVGNWDASRRPQSSFFSLLGFMGQTKVELNDKGSLVIPSLTQTGGRPREWVEIAPFVWRDTTSHDRIAAQVKDGRVTRWSWELIAPFTVYERVATGKNGSWLKPALYASLGVVLLTFLSWPVGWLVRRKYKAALMLEGSARKAYRATQATALGTVVVLGGWAAAISLMSGNLKLAGSAMDPVLMGLQALSVLGLGAAILAAAWNFRLAMTDGRSRLRKFWSVLLLLAALAVFYVAANFGMMSFTVNY